LSRRTYLLLGLLALVASFAAWLQFGRATPEPVGASDAIEHPARVLAREEPVAHPRIADTSGILAPFGPRLGRMTDDFFDDLGVDVHIVTVTERKPIERLAERIFVERAIGQAAPTGGILVLLDPATREARIEVGYSLEGGLTDLHMGRIARDQLAPYVSYASSGMAVMDVLHYLRDQVYLAAALGDIQLGEEFRRRGSFAEYQGFVSGGAGAKTALSTVPMDADLKAPVPPARRSRYAPSADVKASVAAYLRVMADLAGDPTLPLFTEGSRLMRASYPFARFEELQRLSSIDASLPLEYRFDGDHAVATSVKPAKGFTPILLHREQGLWRVDLVETWKNLFFDKDGNYFLRNSNTPYRFGLAGFGEGRPYDIGQLPLGGRTIAEELARLEGRTDVLSTLRRAEVSLRNAFVFPQALADYEKALSAAPGDPLVLQTIAERAQYLGFPELALPALEEAGPGFEIALAEACHDMGDSKSARRWIDRALENDRYDLYALNWKKFLAERDGSPADVDLAQSGIDIVMSDPRRLANPVWLRFEPEFPRFHPATTVRSGGTTVYDHSRFRVTMTNTSRRPVVVESVRLTSSGTANASGLGDVKDYWKYPSGSHHLEPGESVSFDKLWGFTVDTGHEHVRYAFRTCWHGLGETVRQCRVQRVDVLP
jgi:tetratricopeptide (TPR) repeat protein